MARNIPEDDMEHGSFPSGNGGRVKVYIHRNREGGDLSIDPDQSIFSGMRKRNARETGIWTTAPIEDADYE